MHPKPVITTCFLTQYSSYVQRMVYLAYAFCLLRQINGQKGLQLCIYNTTRLKGMRKILLEFVSELIIFDLVRRENHQDRELSRRMRPES
mgnify:CR=1 FL=1